MRRKMRMKSSKARSGTYHHIEFFPIRTPEEARGAAVKRGAGSQQQAKVLVIVESKAVDDIIMEYMSRKMPLQRIKPQGLQKEPGAVLSGKSYTI